MERLQESLEHCRSRVDAALDGWLQPQAAVPESLQAALRYTVLDGGKRIRPALVYLTGWLFGAADTRLDSPACAVELIHAYSLVHDDLPAMDDDDLRRGKPTCHRAFDEATAILAGDALQTLAFEILTSNVDPADAPVRLRMVRELSKAAGAAGMVGGQALDMASEGKRLTLAELERMHRLKTGALIRASVRLGALAGGATEAQLEALDSYASGIGLAFQIRDDLLDVEGDTATLGKSQGADQAREKSTYTSLMSLEEARQRARQAVDDALDALQPFGEDARLLRELAEFVIERVR